MPRLPDRRGTAGPRRQRLARILALALPLALPLTIPLAGCGDLPRPFAGNPGATARRLAEPPPARLVVAPPPSSVLAPRPGGDLARALARALNDRAVPAFAQPPSAGDWSITLGARSDGLAVTPSAQLHDAKNADQGSVDAPPVPARAWADGDAAVLADTAAALAPKLEDVLRAAVARVAQNDPNSLLNRPAKILLRAVSGAPGDGNRVLYASMRQHLLGTGDVLTETAADADFIVTPRVIRRRVDAATDQIEIHWHVTTGRGDEAGDVAQGHDFPAGSLDGYWGEVAEAVTLEAAPGVHTVITNYSGRNLAGHRQGGKAPPP